MQGEEMALTFTRCLELLVVGVFYAGLCYMIFGGVGMMSCPTLFSMVETFHIRHSTWTPNEATSCG